MESRQVKKILGELSKPQLISLNKEFHSTVPVLATKKQLVSALVTPQVWNQFGAGRPELGETGAVGEIMSNLDQLPDPALFQILSRIGYFQTNLLKSVNHRLREKLERPEYQALLKKIETNDIAKIYQIWEAYREPNDKPSKLSTDSTALNLNIDKIPPGLSLFVNLKKLDIRGVNEFPIEITALPQLRILRVIGSFYSIPPEIKNLKKLRELYLRTNIIPPPPGQRVYLPARAGFTLPPEFGQLENLRHLDLSENIKVPPEIGQIPNLLCGFGWCHWYEFYKIQRLLYISPKLSPEDKITEIERPIPYDEFRLVNQLLRIGFLDNEENIKQYLTLVDLVRRHGVDPVVFINEFWDDNATRLPRMSENWTWRYFEWVRTNKLNPASIPDKPDKLLPLQNGIDQLTYQKILTNLSQLRNAFMEARSYNDFKNRIIDIVGSGRLWPYGWSTESLSDAILNSNLPMANQIKDKFHMFRFYDTTDYRGKKLVNMVLYLLLLDDYKKKDQTVNITGETLVEEAEISEVIAETGETLGEEASIVDTGGTGEEDDADETLVNAGEKE